MSGPLSFPFRRVGLVGLGLLGGSLGRALKGLGSPPIVRALSVDPLDLEGGLQAGALDEVSPTPEALFPALDLVVYATPPAITLELLSLHREHWGKDLVVTDVVSLKAPLLDRMISMGEGHRYVGSHPMAGGEGRGFGASRTDLFADARVWLTESGAGNAHRSAMESFWKALGAHPRWVDALAHDHLMILASHLPQITANALALVLEGEGLPREELGPGGRDMTRLAGSAPEMWGDLFRWAGPELTRAIGSLEEALGRLRGALEEGRGPDVTDAMERTRKWFRGKAWS